MILAAFLAGIVVGLVVGAIAGVVCTTAMIASSWRPPRSRPRG